MNTKTERIAWNIINLYDLNNCPKFKELKKKEIVKLKRIRKNKSLYNCGVED